MKLATLVYLRQNGHTLMMQRGRKPGDIHAGKWNGLGGKFEPGESPEQCAIREVQEESGLTLVDPQLRGVLTFPRFKENEDWYVFVFVGNSLSGELVADSPEGGLDWIPDSQLLSLPLWEGDRIFLPLLDEPLFFSGRFAYINGQLAAHEIVRHVLPPPGPRPGMSAQQQQQQ